MQSRRQLLQQALVLPFVPQVLASKCCIISGPDCLSQESASGYLGIVEGEQFSLARLESANVILVAGVASTLRTRLLELRSNVQRGALLIWENHAFSGGEKSLLQETFDLRLGESLDGPHEMYVRYRWPGSAMIRTFGGVIPVECRDAEAIAHLGGKPMAIKRRIGKGCFIFLGSMLGPHLRSGDREARELARGLMRPGRFGV